MPNYTIQLRRGTSAEHSSFTGAAGEITVNTTRDSIHVHDGSTAGGTELATKASVDNLSSNAITDADADTHVKVEASSDNDEVQMTAGGNLVAKITSAAILPGANDTYNLGASGTEWNDVFVDNLRASALITDGTMSIASGSLTSVVNMTTTGNVVIGGNLTVSGTQTIVNTETLTVDDNIIVLNNNQSGSPTENAGIEVERGDSTNKTLIWDESADNWTVGSETFVAGLFSGVASSAKYADLAERYHSGAAMEAGTVVCFGGDNEIEMCNEDAPTRVAGVISTAPAFMMNKDAGNDDTHPYVALSGRVPCKVTGPIAKGDMLVGTANGHAKASSFIGGAMIGKALENFDGESGVIEVLVNLM